MNSRTPRFSIILIFLVPYAMLCAKMIMENSFNNIVILLAPLVVFCILLYSEISILLYILILLNPYDLPYPKFFIAGASLGIVNILKSFGLDALIFIKMIGTNWKKTLFSDTAAKAYGAYIIINLLSVLISPSKSNGLKILLELLHPYFVYVLISSLIKNKGATRNIIDMLILSGLFTVILAIVQIILGKGFSVEDVLRLSILGLSKNAYAAFLVIMVISCYSLYLLGDRKKYFYYSVLFAVMIILTGTRIAMIAVIITGFLLYWITKKKTKGIAIAFLLLFAVWNLPQSINRITRSNTGFFSTMDRILNGESIDNHLNTGNLYGRTHFWNIGFDLFRAHPIIGNGLGASAVILEVNGERRVISSHGDVTRIHSEWIRVLSDVGILGFMVLFFSFYLFGKKSFNNYRYAKTNFTRSVSLAAFLSLIAYIIVGVTEVVSSFYYQIGVPVWTLLGYSNHLYQQEKDT